MSLEKSTSRYFHSLRRYYYYSFFLFRFFFFIYSRRGNVLEINANSFELFLIAPRKPFPRLWSVCRSFVVPRVSTLYAQCALVRLIVFSDDDNVIVTRDRDDDVHSRVLNVTRRGAYRFALACVRTWPAGFQPAVRGGRYRPRDREKRRRAHQVQSLEDTSDSEDKRREETASIKTIIIWILRRR